MTTDSIGPDGITIQTNAEITADLVAGMQAIYGPDINVDQNSPDGQMLGLVAQEATDLRELLVQTNASFDPDQAVGALLDQRVAINNIARNGGTFTVQPISITTNATVTLQGLDDNYSDINGTGYTVQDGSGNQFILAATTTFTAGTTVANFRAKAIGDVSVPINTIVNPVTIITGVTGVNNPTAAISVGQNQETDAQLRVRRQQSVALATTGYLNGLLGKILNLSGVTKAKAYQNNTDVTDGDGTLPHTMWLVVAGGSNDDIADTIYTTINGAGMRGAVTKAITTPSGSVFTAKWDVPVSASLYIDFTIQTTVSGTSFNLTAIKDYIAENSDYDIGEFAETSALVVLALEAIASTGGGGVPVLMTISDDGISYTDYLPATGPQYEWTVDATNISIAVV